MSAKATPPMMIAACLKTGADQRQRRGYAGEDDDRGDDHADDAFADDQAGGEQHTELLCCLPGFGVRSARAIEEPTDDRADHDHQRARVGR